MINGGGGGGVKHRILKNYIEIPCNPISPPEMLNILNNIRTFRKKIFDKFLHKDKEKK